MEKQVGIESRGIDVESGRLESGCRHDTMYNVNLQLSMCCCFILFVFFLTPLQSHAATINAVRRNEI